jgi:hypothetical protein
MLPLSSWQKSKLSTGKCGIVIGRGATRLGTPRKPIRIRRIENNPRYSEGL